MSVGLINPEIAEKGGRIAKALVEGGTGGWSTLVGKNIAFALVDADFGRPAEVIRPGEFDEAVLTRVDWSGEAAGPLCLVVPAAGAREVVAFMMALMLGGDADPDATQLDSEGMDAYTEAVNSFFGQGAQQARGEIGGNIKTVVGETKLVDFAKDSPAAILGEGEFLYQRVKVTIEGSQPFILGMFVSREATGVVAESGAEGGEDRAAMAERLGVEPSNLAIAMKIKLPLVVAIASKKMRMELIQDMTPGTIIEFKKMSGENLDVLAGNVKVAMAEAVIINQCFGVQIRSIVDPQMSVPH